MKKISEKQDLFLNGFGKINGFNSVFPNIILDDNRQLLNNNNYISLNLLDNFDFIKFGNLMIPRLKFSFINSMETNKNLNNNVFQNDNIISNKEEIKKDEDVQKTNINNIKLNEFNINSSFNSENYDEINKITIKNDNILEPPIKKKKKYRKVFNLKFYDKEFNLITKKRGRLSLNKNITHIHTAMDYDNILRKIQVHSLTFLVNFTNDYIATLSPNSSAIPFFKHIDYKLKRKINHSYIKEIKYLRIGDILQYPVSKKNRASKENQNVLTYQEIIKLFPFLEESYFNLKLKQFFSQYYYNTSEKIIKINGLDVNLSIKTQTFNHLIQKNPNYSEKMKSIAIYFYINENKTGKTQENEGEKIEIDETIKNKPFFIIE